jgi:hypothetical protein
MDGKRIRDYWSSEVDALLSRYRQFETLIPAADRAGSAHSGEDGRFVEDLLREHLTQFLPTGLEVLTGFILRPAVKTGESGREREGEKDDHSTQLDIIVFDSARYPIFQRFGLSVVVPPEGVVAVISVKKTLTTTDVKTECEALRRAGWLCQTLASNTADDTARGPYLAVVSTHSTIENERIGVLGSVFNQIAASYKGINDLTFDQTVGYVGALGQWSVFKRRPNGATGVKAEYVGFTHDAEESHMGLQFLLTGILSVFYDKTRRNVRRPGFTAFPSGRPHDKVLGCIDCARLR